MESEEGKTLSWLNGLVDPFGVMPSCISTSASSMVQNHNMTLEDHSRRGTAWTTIHQSVSVTIREKDIAEDGSTRYAQLYRSPQITEYHTT